MSFPKSSSGFVVRETIHRISSSPRPPREPAVLRVSARAGRSPWLPPNRYSRKANTGSMRVARRAGPYDARNATTISNTLTPA